MPGPIVVHPAVIRSIRACWTVTHITLHVIVVALALYGVMRIVGVIERGDSASVPI